MGEQRRPPERIAAAAAALNDRQRAYLLVAYTEDQRREAVPRGPHASPARVWRWIEYGPVGAAFLDAGGRFLLRLELQNAGLVDQGTGATWNSLQERGLVLTRHVSTGLLDARSRRPIVSLEVRMTIEGRKVARFVNGEPLTRPKQGPKPLTLSALRLLAFGQAHPTTAFRWNEPSDGSAFVPDFLMMRGIIQGLVKRGLLTGEAPDALRITPAGQDLDVTNEPNWLPRRAEAHIAVGRT